jgi:hypothetical protein
LYCRVEAFDDIIDLALLVEFADEGQWPGGVEEESGRTEVVVLESERFQVVLLLEFEDHLQLRATVCFSHYKLLLITRGMRRRVAEAELIGVVVDDKALAHFVVGEKPVTYRHLSFVYSA